MFNFTTPHGLKIRLVPQYFYALFTNSEGFAPSEDMVDNDRMYSAVQAIENAFSFPSMLVFIFSICAILFNFELSTYLIGSTALFFLGRILRVIKSYIIGPFLQLLGIIYNLIPWYLRILSIVILFFITKNTYLMVPFVLLTLGLWLLETFVLNTTILRITNKKYGVPFNDTEICAFRVFHHMLAREDSLSAFIEEYVCTVHGA